MEARVKELLAGSNARIVESLRDQLYDADVQIDEAAKDKQEMAVAMHALQQNVLRLRKALDASETRAASLEKSSAEIASRHETTQQKLEKIVARMEAFEKRSLEEKARADAKEEEKLLLEQVCGDLKKALKAQELADGATKQHIRFLESQAQQEENQRLVIAKRLQDSQNEARDLQARLKAQEHETKLAQTHVDKVAHELKALGASKAVVQAQWQASLLAMTKRDEILQEAEKRRVEAETRLENELKAVGSTTQMVSSLRARVESLEEELAQGQRQAVSQTNLLNAQTKQLAASNLALENERAKLRRAVAVFEETQKSAVSAEAHSQRHFEERQALSAQVDALKRKLENSERELVLAQNQCRTIEASAAAQDAKLVTESERTAVELQNRVSRQAVEMQGLRQQILQHEKDVAGASEREKAALAQGDELTRENRRLVAANLRLQHKLNKADDKNRVLGAGDGQPEHNESGTCKPRTASAEVLRQQELETRLQRAQRVIEAQAEEISVLRNEWSRAEDEVIKGRNVQAKLKVPSERRDTELALARHFHEKSRAETDVAHAAGNQLAVQLDVARAEQRKANEVKARLSQDKSRLSQTLVDASFRFQAASADLESEVDSLKASLVDSRRSNHAVLKQQLDTESKLTAVQHRYRSLHGRLQDTHTKMLAAEKEVKSLRASNVKLARENGALKQAVQKLEQAQARSEEMLLRSGRAEGSTAKSAQGVASISANPEIRKMQAALYHAETEVAQGLERATKLAHQVEMERDRAQRLGQAYVEREELAKKLAQELGDTKAALLQAQSARSRAIAVAAALEAQLTGIVPFIKYEPHQGVAPSPRLQTALIKTLQPRRPAQPKAE